MNNGYPREDLEAILESLESDESDESDEAVWRRPSYRRPAPRTAPGSGSYRAPVQNTYVTQRELQESIQRVDAKITTNSDAIKAVNARVNTLGTDVARQTTVVKKETDERKKDVSGLRNNVQLSALLPLLTQPKTKDVTAENVSGTGLTKGDKILVDGSNSLSALLPVILLGGLGTSSDSSSSGGAGGMNDLTTLFLVLALTQNK